MDDARWDALVRRLEPLARSNPAGYRRKVLLLAALGYAFIGALLAVLLGCAVLVVVLALKSSALLLKLLIPVGALFWVTLRSLYVRFEPPNGFPLKRQDAPALFAMIGDVRKAVRGPKVHQVVVDGEPNAGVVQVPRAGGIFGSRNYLVLGLPYLEALSAEEFRAVLAHELGHLSSRHGRFGSFVYRVRATWIRLLEGFEDRESIWTGVVRRFFLWYVPYFNAYTFPAMRAHEFEADEAAAAAAGREVAASSLVAGMIAGSWVYESYWPEVYRRARSEPVPPEGSFAAMAEQIGQARQREGLDRWYRRMLEVETDPTDTHPSVAERIAHLGVDPQQVLRAATADGQPSAASVYLGDAEARLLSATDLSWREEVRPQWISAHAEAQRERRELDELEARESLAPDEALRRAELTETFHSASDALALYLDLVGSEHDAPARFAVGRLLLERGDAEGLRWLDEVIEREPDAALPGCELAYDFLRGQGRDEDAESYRVRAEQYAEVLAAAASERSEVSVEDRLDPPDLADELREHVRAKVGRHPEVVEAYLVRKRTEHFDDIRPFYVVGLIPKSGFRKAWREAGDDVEPLEQRVANDLRLPQDVIVVTCGRESPLAEHLAAVPGSRIV